MKEIISDWMIEVKKAVIPAAGLGTRFLPATKAQPKEMLPVFDKPTIQYVVEEVVASGIEDILIITGRGKRAIEDHFDRSIELELALSNSGKKEHLENIRNISEIADIHFIRQKEQRGLGDAVYCARKFVGNEPFALLLGDTITIDKVPCTKRLSTIFQKYKASVISVERVPREKISSYGIVKSTPSDDVHIVHDLVEKPQPETAPSNLGIIGRYILTPEIFECIERVAPGVGNEVQLTDALRLLLNKQKIFACEFNGRRYDIGNKIDWLKATIELALENNEVNEELLKFLNSIVTSRQ